MLKLQSYYVFILCFTVITTPFHVLFQQDILIYAKSITNWLLIVSGCLDRRLSVLALYHDR